MLLADMAMSHTYDPRLVGLSIVIAVLASYTAVDLAGRVTLTQARARLTWLIGGAIVMGMGIWSMHFVGMLAYSLPIPMSYDVLLVLLSILPAIIASLGALFLASRQFLSQRRLLIGGILMGIGIASMHYVGMLAMRMEAAIHYQPVLFILSILIAISASIVALWIAFQLRLQIGKGSLRPKILSAFVMGAGISGMHYTGMAAASFTPTQMRSTAIAAQEMQASFTWLAVGIGIAMLIILSCTLLTTFVDRRIVTQGMLLKQQQAEAERSQLFTEATLRIRHSLKLDDVLNTAVTEVRKALNLDRVIVYYFNPDLSGTIIAESVGQGWMKTRPLA